MVLENSEARISAGEAGSSRTSLAAWFSCLVTASIVAACATVTPERGDGVADTVTDPVPETDMEADAGPVECLWSPDCGDDACVDGYCCDGLCNGLCEACDVPGSEGLCTPWPAGEDPGDECGQDGPDTCGQTGSCDGAGACALYEAATECDDGEACTEGDVCTGSGECVGGPLAVCDPGPSNQCCTSGCSSVVGCYTEPGSCAEICGTGQLTTGQSCAGCGPANAEGICTGGTVTSCTSSSHSLCQFIMCGGSTYYCTNVGDVWAWRTTVGCSDGNDCTYNDACSGGGCSGTTFSCESDDCMQRACDGGGDCIETPRSSATTCGTTTCLADSCSGGSHFDYPADCTRYCDGAGTCLGCNCSPSVTPCATGTGDECCDEACSAGAGCYTNPGSCGTGSDVCTDPNLLQIGSMCTGCGVNGANGECSGGGSFECNASVHTLCQSVSCGSVTYYCTAVSGSWRWRADPACDDSNLCSFGDTCGGPGICSGTPVYCADTACMDRACNGTSFCTSTPFGSSTSCGTNTCLPDSCSGGSWWDYPPSCTNYCDGAGGCNICSCTATSTTCTVGAGNVCCQVSCDTVLGCRTAAGSCAAADSCTNPNFLTAGNTCMGCGSAGANGSCEGGAPVECSASVHSPCQATICGGTTYRCTNSGGTWQWRTTASCDDGNACTHDDECAGSTCSGTPISCADSTCVDRECNGTSSCSIAYPSATTCTDGDACTTGETCNGAGSCTGGTSAAVCGDGACNCGETAVGCPSDCNLCVLPRTLASWDSGAEGWTFNGNWGRSTSGGSPGGYMRFDDESPSHRTSYSGYPLTSPVMDLLACTSARLRYSITLSDYLDSSWSNDEYIRVQCSGNGSTWTTTLATYVDGDDYSNEDFGWTSYTHVLPDGCRTATAYVRFLAAGDDSWEINYWGIDTVSLQP